MGITPEGKIKARVRRILEINKVYHFMPATGGYGRSGVPDIVGCANGKFFAIECKASADKKPTALQQKELDHIEEAGGFTFIVCDDRTVKHFEVWLVAAMTVPTTKKEIK